MGTGGLLLRRLRARLLDSPTGFSWIYPGRLAASGFPSSKNQIRWAEGRGVNSVLTLTETALPVEWFSGESAKVKQIPMDDHKPPSLELLDELASYIEDEVEGGRTLLVHCLAGKGRTGTALAAYLVKKEGMSAADAIEFLRERRPGSVERGQETSLREYEAFLGQTRPRLQR